MRTKGIVPREFNSKAMKKADLKRATKRALAGSFGIMMLLSGISAVRAGLSIILDKIE